MNGAANAPRNGPRNGQTAPQGNSSWNVDLFHCAPSGSVFTSIFQPCVIYGRVEERMRNPYLENYDGSNDECQNFYKKACCIFGPLGCMYVKQQRQEVRERYGIPGSSGSDCATATFCCCCALVQHDNEVESRGPKQRSNKVDTTGYQANTGSMFMPAADRGSWYMSADARTSSYRG